MGLEIKMETAKVLSDEELYKKLTLALAGYSTKMNALVAAFVEAANELNAEAGKRMKEITRGENNEDSPTILQ